MSPTAEAVKVTQVQFMNLKEYGSKGRVEAPIGVVFNPQVYGFIIGLLRSAKQFRIEQGEVDPEANVYRIREIQILDVGPDEARVVGRYHVYADPDLLIELDTDHTGRLVHDPVLKFGERRVAGTA